MDSTRWPGWTSAVSTRACRAVSAASGTAARLEQIDAFTSIAETVLAHLDDQPE